MIRVFRVSLSLTLLLLGTVAAQAGATPALVPLPGHWPDGGTFTVYLCAADDAWEACGDEAVTAAQRRAVERRLREMPWVTGVRHESPAEARARMAETMPDAARLLEEFDMPEAFHGELSRWSDAPAFNTAAKAWPGVANTNVFPFSYWRGKADVTIRLCGPPEEHNDDCSGRGPATAEEKAALEKNLRALEDVERVHFQDREFAAWEHTQLLRRWAQGWRTDPHGNADDARTISPEDSPESYHVRLSSPDRADAVIRAVRGAAGVAEVYEIS
jgi:cell division protein FtsX